VLTTTNTRLVNDRPVLLHSYAESMGVFEASPMVGRTDHHCLILALYC